MKSPLVSVVVPVFNAGPGVDRCMRSLRAQTLQDIEIVVVDDRGDDGSMEAVARHASQDPRIRVVRNERNMGAGPSRNAGIEAASGEYLSFVDPDDFVSPDFLELLYGKASESGADIVKGSRVNYDASCPRQLDDYDPTDCNARLEELIWAGLPLYAVFTYEHTTAIYRRGLLEESGARYGTSRNGQDTTFLLRVCHAARSLELERGAVYYYVQREGSAVRTFDARRLENEIKALEEKIDYVVERLGFDEPAYRLIANHIRWHLRTHGLALRQRSLVVQAEAFLSNLRLQASRLPMPNLLRLQGLDMCALLDYGVNFSFSADAADSNEAAACNYLDSLQRWSAFLCEIRENETVYHDEYEKRVRYFLKRHLQFLPDSSRDAQILKVIESADFACNSKYPKGPLVSVVVPVFNAGPGVDRCMRSLRAQTLQDIEIVVVDDRGDDGSMEAVARHASQDPRIRVVRNERNMGAGPSRNAGIEAASGEYLSFVDPDDFVSPDFLELLYGKASESGADIVKGSRVNYDASCPRQLDDYDPTDCNARLEELIWAGLPLYAVFTYEHTTAIYRRGLLEESGARYGTSRNGQDTTFLLRVCHAARSLELERGAVYYYVQREGSAVRTFDARRLENEIKALEEKIDYVVEHVELNSNVIQYVSSRLLSILAVHALAVSKGLSHSDTEAFLNAIRKQATRLPYLNELKAANLVVRALIDYGANLSLSASAAGSQGTSLMAREQIIKRWTIFLAEHPHLVPAYGNQYILLIEMALRELSISQDSYTSEDPVGDYIHMLRCQLSAVPSISSMLHENAKLNALYCFGANMYVGINEKVEDLGPFACLERVKRWMQLYINEERLTTDLAHALRDSIREALRAHLSLKRDNADFAAQYLSSLREIVLNAPNTELLARQGIDIRALIEHESNLCSPVAVRDLRRRVSSDADAVARWKEFIEADYARYEQYGSGLENRIRLLRISQMQLLRQGI